MSLAATAALRVINHVPALLAYWDADLRCVFANNAYRIWFGRSPEEMHGIHIKEVIGAALYEKNLAFIRAALAGEYQRFDRQIPLPNGEIRDAIATYIPDIVDGRVLGFSVHVADVSDLRRRESILEAAIEETIATLELTKRSFRSKELGQLRARLLQIGQHRSASLGAPDLDHPLGKN